MLRRSRFAATEILRASARAAARACWVEALECRQFLSGTTASAPTTSSASATLAAALARPQVNFTSPEGGATNVRRDAFLSADVLIPNGGIRLDTMVSANVYLTRAGDGTKLKSVLNTSGGGDVIVLRPESRLDANTSYTFHVTSGLKDVAGQSFVPFELTFTTGTATGGSSSNVKFTKKSLSTTSGNAYTSLAIGPDHKMYAATFDGNIIRWKIQSDGTLSGKELFTTIRDKNGGKRTIAGITFDPASTASNPILWVTHSTYGLTGAPDWAGKISLLSDDASGKDLAKYRDRVINLPRASRDHMTNQLAWGPDGALYFSQGSSSAMGAPDAAWGNRKEHLLSAAILRVDPALLPADRALDVKTSDGGGHYDPEAAGAPLTIYATGVRNAFNVLWHSNGNLYAPGNGSAAGGNTPGHGDVPGLKNVSRAENDYLFKVEKDGYYGHPNPVRGEYVLNGGNPTRRKDSAEVTDYPTGTEPDSNYRGYAFDFGSHISPNGALEYTNGQAFGGALVGKILVTRYSGPDDIIALTVGADGNITGDQTGISGFTGFNNPVDLVEDPASGNIYVAEFGPEDSSDEPGGRKITLLKAQIPPQTKARFQSADVESQDPGGTTIVAEGKSYDVTAGGWNIGGEADGFRFLYEQRTGDFDISVKVESLDAASAIAKAGLMARDSLAAEARNVFASVSFGDGYRFSSRAEAGAATLITKSERDPALPCYIRLSRVGNAFTGYFSTDGTNWEVISHQTLPMPQTLYFGLAASSGSAVQGEMVTAKFRDLADVATSSPTPSPTPTPTPTPTTTIGKLKWSSAASAPTVRGDAGAAAVDGKLYLFGGYTDDNLDRTTRIDVYDPVTNKWTPSVARMPVALGHVQTAVDGHDVYLAGGVIADRNGGTSSATFTLTDAVWRFNTDTMQFTPMPSLPKVAAMGGMVLVGRELHYIAGAKENGLQQRGDHWVLNLDDLAAGWQTAASLPTPRKRFASVALDGKIYIIGGHTGDYSGRTYLSAVHVFDPATGAWTKIASLPSGHSHFHNAADVYNGRIVVAGGKTDSEAASNDVLMYNPSTDKWSTLTNLPSGRSSGPMRVLNDTLVYTTGSSGGGSFESTTWRGTFVTT